MKKPIFILNILLICFILVSCGPVKETEKKFGEKEDFEEIIEETIEEKIIRTDKDKMLEVHIENGEAQVYFDLEKWDEEYNLSEYTSIDELFEGPYPIIGLSGKIKDALIAKIGKFHYLNAGFEEVPAIFLLIEDGGVEWTPADFYLMRHHPSWPSLMVMDPLSNISDIVTLTAIENKEKKGEMIVFAIDSKGVEYDLNTALKQDINYEAAEDDKSDEPKNGAGEQKDNMQYLLEKVPKAREMVEVYGMKMISYGEFSEISGEICEDIWLGTDHPDHFVNEILYSISPSGIIYELDIVNNEWIIVWK